LSTALDIVEEPHMKAKLLACILVVSLTSPVSAATYYIWSSNRTQKCSVAIRKPLLQSKAYILVGNETGYKSRKEAIDAIKSVGVCKMTYDKK
jgi:hypothetical protein